MYGLLLKKGTQACGNHLHWMQNKCQRQPQKTKYWQFAVCVHCLFFTVHFFSTGLSNKTFYISRGFVWTTAFIYTIIYSVYIIFYLVELQRQVCGVVVLYVYNAAFSTGVVQ